jgi:hypothetical protein
MNPIVDGRQDDALHRLHTARANTSPRQLSARCHLRRSVTNVAALMQRGESRRSSGGLPSALAVSVSRATRSSRRDRRP